MSKTKKKNVNSQIKRRRMIEEVFKKGKKQREVAKKFDDKIAQKQGKTVSRKHTLQQTKKKNRSDGHFAKDHLKELDQKFEQIRASKKLA